MTREYDQANALQRLLRRFAASGPGAWLFARVLHHVDRPFYRLTRGRWTFASLVSGIPVVITAPVAERSKRSTSRGRRRPSSTTRRAPVRQTVFGTAA